MNNRYDQLVGHAPDGIVVHDGERILEVNAAMIRLAGASDAEQLVGRPVADVLSPPHLRAVEQQLVAAFSGAEARNNTDAHVLRANGELCDVELSSQLFLDSDRPAVHVVVRDLTAQRAQARALQIAEDREHLRKRMQLVRALAGGVAHEMNNMLQMVIGYAAVLENDTLTATQLADIAEIQQAAARAAALTRQLTQFAGSAEPRPHLVDLAKVVPHLFREYRQPYGNHRCVLVECDEPVMVTIDVAHLRLVFDSLMSNACRAASSGGEVRIRATRTTLSAALTEADGRLLPAGEYGVLTIADSGVGMSEDTQRQLFLPFFTTQSVGEGMGLGLASASGLLLQNNAFITFTSAPGEGSAFTVWIPLAPTGDLPSAETL